MHCEFACGHDRIPRRKIFVGVSSGKFNENFRWRKVSSRPRSFSSPLDDAPALVEAQREKLLETERAHRKIATELAQARGRELYGATAPGPTGLRRVERRVPTLSDDTRAEARMQPRHNLHGHQSLTH